MISVVDGCERIQATASSVTDVSGGWADPAQSVVGDPHAVNRAVDIATRPTADTVRRACAVMAAR
jgi:hypothetical protein